jgi:uncharacterized protein YjdB
MALALSLALLLTGIAPVGLGAPGTARASGGSMVVNGGFEDTVNSTGNGWGGKSAVGWEAPWMASGSPVVTVNQAVYHSGGNALEIRAAASSKATVASEPVPVTGGEHYRLSGWVAAENVTQAFIRLMFFGSSGPDLGYKDSAAVRGTAGWQPLGVVAQIPANAVKVKAICYFNTGTGVARFDDIELIRVVPVSGITVSGPSHLLETGGSIQLAASLSPLDATTPEITWTSSNPQAAVVNENGVVTGTGQGAAVITAAAADHNFNRVLTAQYDVEVLDHSSNLLDNGSYEEASAPEAGAGWGSAQAAGWLAAMGAGSLADADQSVSLLGSRSLRLDSSGPAGGSVYQEQAVTAGQMYRLREYIRTSAASEEPGAAVRLTFRDAAGAETGEPWQSANYHGMREWQLLQTVVQAPAGAASLRVENLLASAGTAWFDAALLEPYDPVTSVSLSRTSGELERGGELQLHAAVAPASATDQTVLWESSDSAVASVAEGLVKAVGLGPAVITARSADGRHASFKLLVVAPELTANSGFETTAAAVSGDRWVSVKASGWGTPWLAVGTPQVTVDNAVYRSGGHSLRISAQVSSKATVGQSAIPVEAGLMYRFGAYVRTEGISSQAFLRVYFYGMDGGQISYADTSFLSGTKDWTKLEKTVQAPAGAVKAQYANYYNTGTGTAWFDDTTLKQVIPLESVQFSSLTGFVPVGGTLSVEPVYTPWNTTERELGWSSSNGLAAVSQGMITGVAPGIAIIEATPQRGGSESGSGHARMAVAVTNQPEELTIGNITVAIEENAHASGAFPAADSEGRTLRYLPLALPASGTLHLMENGQWSYYPNPDTSGTDSFAAAAFNESGGLGGVRAEIVVEAANHSPLLAQAFVSTDRNTAVEGVAAATDADGDNLVYSLHTGPQHGTASVAADGSWIYTPAENYTGPDEFVVSVVDGRGGEAAGVITAMTALSGEEMMDLLYSRNQDGRIPRIIVGMADFDRISELAPTDGNMASWYANVKELADEALAAPPSQYVLGDGVRLLEVSREVLKRVRNLAMFYRISGETVYAERAWEELATAAAFPDWHPVHFLDTAEMTAAAAIGYDWLYEYWTPERRSTLRTAIVEKGLNPALTFYRNRSEWTVRTNNWNSVCNGGIAMGALAIAGDDPSLDGMLGEILTGGIRSLPLTLNEYKPDGGWFEGPTYWDYGTSYAIYYLSSLEQSLGTDFGLSTMPGFADTVKFPMYMTGTAGSYNFADASADFVASPTVLWFAQRFADPEFAWYHKQMSAKKRGGVLDLIWYRPELYQAAQAPGQLDEVFQYVRAAGMRSLWSDDQGLFVGFKGGDNQFAHGDLDIGSFVFDALGVRWVEDFGAENYNLPAYWDYGANGGRWKYYRKRAEGHNTLLINPDSGPDQHPYAKGEVESFYSGPREAWGIVDLTTAYQDDVLSAKRGFKLGKGRTELLIQDEIRAKGPADVRWQIHTQAAVEVAPDGKSATLGYRDRRLLLEIASPARGSFYTAAAAPLPSSPNPAGQSANGTFTTVGIRLENTLEETIAVRFVPLLRNQAAEADVSAVIPIEEWVSSSLPRAELWEITMDGSPLADFQAGKWVYEVKLPFGTQAMPVFGAAAGTAGDTVTITPPPSLPGLAIIEVQPSDSSRVKATYYVSLGVEPHIGLPEAAQLLPVAQATASAVDQAYVPENTLDGSLHIESRWSALSGNWIQYDLGETRSISGLALAFMRGNERKTYFNVLASHDGLAWTHVLYGTSTGQTLDYEYYELPNLSARYIRIVGYGNDQNKFTSLTEAAVIAETEAQAPAAP